MVSIYENLVNRKYMQSSTYFSRFLVVLLPGAGERHSTRDKGHEEGGSAYAKAGSSLGSAPGYSRLVCGTWGISPWLLQQSAAAAPYLGHGVAPLSAYSLEGKL